MECARCHAEQCSAPPLDRQTLVQYGNATAIHQLISFTMPFDDPGSLAEDDYWAITAYLLSREGLLELSSNATLGPETADQALSPQ